MKRKELTKRIGAAALAIVTTFSASVIIFHAYNKEKFKNIKTSSQIIQECEDLNIDYSYLKSYKDKCLVLDIKPDEPVLIKYDFSMPKKEIDIISKAVNYCDKIFKSIDSNYDFELISNEDIRNDDAIIDIKNGVVGDEYGHWNDAKGINNSGYKHLIDKNIIVKSNIIIDWEAAQQIGDQYSYYVILHELAHSFGLDDVYHVGKYKNTDCNYGITVMNSDSTDIVEFHPNDYALLQALYSREYLDQEEYKNVITAMNEKIKDYEIYFFNKLATDLINRNENYFLYEEKEVLENLSFEWDRIGDDGSVHYISAVINDGICKFTIKDEKGKTLEECESETIYAEGILFIKNIKINNINNYTKGEHNGSCKIMFFVAHNSKGDLIIRDNLYNDGTSIKLTKEKSISGR